MTRAEVIVIQRIVQLSDPHLMTEDDGMVRGVPTWLTLRETLELVRATSPDAIVFTGDIAQDERGSTYRKLAVALEDLGLLARAWFVPGNHDDPAALRDVLGARAGAAAAIGVEGTLGGWRWIAIDSHVAGDTSGTLGPDRLAWLAARLRSHATAPTLLFVHHPPVDVGTAWLDPLGLQDGDALADVLAGSEIRAVFHGHAHMASVAALRGIPVYGAPSTAFQFRPGEAEPHLDLLSPGFRIIELDGDAMRTEVVRLPELRYPPRA